MSRSPGPFDDVSIALVSAILATALDLLKPASPSVVTRCTSQALLPPPRSVNLVFDREATRLLLHRIDAVCCGGKQFVSLRFLHSSNGQQQI